MDSMNLFDKVGKEMIKEENERESSFKESEELNAGLSVDDIAEIEDRDSRTGLEMCCSVNEGGYFHYIREKDDHFSPVIVL